MATKYEILTRNNLGVKIQIMINWENSPLLNCSFITHQTKICSFIGFFINHFWCSRKNHFDCNFLNCSSINYIKKQPKKLTSPSATTTVYTLAPPPPPPLILESSSSSATSSSPNSTPSNAPHFQTLSTSPLDSHRPPESTVTETLGFPGDLESTSREMEEEIE